MDIALHSRWNIWGSISSADNVSKCQTNFSFHTASAYQAEIRTWGTAIVIEWLKVHAYLNELCAVFSHERWDCSSSVSYTRDGNGLFEYGVDTLNYMPLLLPLYIAENYTFPLNANEISISLSKAAECHLWECLSLIPKSKCNVKEAISTKSCKSSKLQTIKFNADIR